MISFLNGFPKVMTSALLKICGVRFKGVCMPRNQEMKADSGQGAAVKFNFDPVLKPKTD